MFKRLLYLGGVVLLFLSCSESPKPISQSGAGANVGGQNVITSLINNRTRTIAICYGNDLAIRSANDSAMACQEGEGYTLITWSQRPMPQWYGTNMNGRLVSIERVTVSVDKAAKILYSYKLQTRRGARKDRKQLKIRERIEFIINLKGAVFPD